MARRSTHGFSVGKKLGAGAFGEVYKASKYGATYAMKRTPINRNLRQVMKEVISLRRLEKHDNVIEFYASFNEPGFLWIVLEYCNGGDLNKYILVNPEISYDQLLGFVKQLATGMEYLHSKDVIHRDIKPDNIMLCYSWFGSITLKVADFGLSRIWKSCNDESPYYILSGSCIGPPYYTAPEAFQGHATKKSDIFSLGCLVMAMFSRTTIPWIGGKPLLAPYIVTYGLLKLLIVEATDDQKWSFIREHVLLHCADKVKFQTLVYSMVDRDCRKRPNAKDVANDIGAGFCNTSIPLNSMSASIPLNSMSTPIPLNSMSTPIPLNSMSTPIPCNPYMRFR